MQSIIESAGTVVAALGDSPETKQGLDRIRSAMQDLIRKEHEVTAHAQVAYKVKGQVRNLIQEGQRDINVDELRATYQEREKKNIPELETEKHSKMKQLESKISAALSQVEGTDMNEDVESVGGESDLAATSYTRSLVDPFTQRDMEEPVKNVICGHSYEKASILKMIQDSKKNGVKCPALGCANRRLMVKEDLVDDLELKRVIQKKRLGR